MYDFTQTSITKDIKLAPLKEKLLIKTQDPNQDPLKKRSSVSKHENHIKDITFKRFTRESLTEPMILVGAQVKPFRKPSPVSNSNVWQKSIQNYQKFHTQKSKDIENFSLGYDNVLQSTHSKSISTSTAPDDLKTPSIRYEDYGLTKNMLLSCSGGGPISTMNNFLSNPTPTPHVILSDVNSEINIDENLTRHQNHHNYYQDKRDSPIKITIKDKFKSKKMEMNSILLTSLSSNPPKKKLKPKVTAKSWSITNGINGELLYGKKPKEIREIASLTKIMTCLVTLNWVKKLNLDPYTTYFKVSAYAASMIGTTANLKTGDELSIWDLLHGMMLPSGNDAAYCLAENLGYYMFRESEEYKEQVEKNLDPFETKIKNPVKYFVREMNNLAKVIGMVDTHYANPHGLINKYNHSTATDVGKLCCNAMKDDLLKSIVCQKTYHACARSVKTEKTREILWENTNKLLNDGFEGIKTGITNTAGPCLAASQNRDNKHLIIVILNSKSCEHRWKEVTKLSNWAFEKMDNEKVIQDVKFA